MVHETDLEPKRGGDLIGTAIVVGTALLGSCFLFAVLCFGMLYLRQ